MCDVSEEAPERDGLGDGGQVDVEDGGQGLDVKSVLEVRHEPRVGITYISIVYVRDEKLYKIFLYFRTIEK